MAQQVFFRMLPTDVWVEHRAEGFLIALSPSRSMQFCFNHFLTAQRQFSEDVCLTLGFSQYSALGEKSSTEHTVELFGADWFSPLFSVVKFPIFLCHQTRDFQPSPTSES